MTTEMTDRDRDPYDVFDTCPKGPTLRDVEDLDREHRDLPEAADMIYRDWMYQESVEPESSTVRDAHVLRYSGRFIRHGVVCTMDADLFAAATLPPHTLTYGAAVEAQILRDKERARLTVDAYPRAGSRSRMNQDERRWRREDRDRRRANGGVN